MADPSKDLWDAASPAMVLLSQSQLAEQLQVRSAGLPGPEGLGNPEDPGPGAAPSGAIVTAGRPRVLLVDDIDDNLCALEDILRPLGLICVRASSGEEAMKALLRDDFALFLSDVVMPGPRRLRDRGPDQAPRPDQGCADHLSQRLRPHAGVPRPPPGGRRVGLPDQSVRSLGAAREGGGVHRAQPAARRALAVSRRAPARLRGNPGRPRGPAEPPGDHGSPTGRWPGRGRRVPSWPGSPPSSPARYATCGPRPTP